MLDGLYSTINLLICFSSRTVDVESAVLLLKLKWKEVPALPLSVISLQFPINRFFPGSRINNSTCDPLWKHCAPAVRLFYEGFYRYCSVLGIVYGEYHGLRTTAIASEVFLHTVKTGCRNIPGVCQKKLGLQPMSHGSSVMAPNKVRYIGLHTRCIGHKNCRF